MTAREFDSLLAARCEKMRDVLGTKAGEYATDSDRLHNFKSASEVFGGTTTAAAWYFMLKHLMSIRDMALGLKPVTPGAVDEKLGDAINYLVLLEALFREQMK